MAAVKVTAVQWIAMGDNASWHCQPPRTLPLISPSSSSSFSCFTNYSPNLNSPLVLSSEHLCHLPPTPFHPSARLFPHLPRSHHLPFPISPPHCLHFISWRSINSQKGRHKGGSGVTSLAYANTLKVDIQRTPNGKNSLCTSAILPVFVLSSLYYKCLRCL